MSENSESISNFLKEMLEVVTDPDAHQNFQNRIALDALERTDPWRYYCRCCGKEETHENRVALNELAMKHLSDNPTTCGRGKTVMTDGAGRLLHIWTYG